MSSPASHLFDLSQPLRQQLRSTARAALAISVFASLALMLTLFYLFKGQQQEDYLNIIRALTRSQDQLIPAMFIGGAMIILVAGLITWFVMLYSSARIAGPLYRFTKNIEMEINEGPVPTIQLRKGDYLQDLSAKLGAAADGLSQNYSEQLKVLDEFDQQLLSAENTDRAQYQKLLVDLKKAARRS